MTLRMRIRSTVAGRVAVSVRLLQQHMKPSDLSSGSMTFATRVLPLVWSRKHDGTEDRADAGVG